jgi:hypothetical protein
MTRQGSIMTRSGKHHDASGKHPDASGKHPDASGKHPDASGKHPDASGKHHDASGKQFAASLQKSDAAGRAKLRFGIACPYRVRPFPRIAADDGQSEKQASSVEVEQADFLIGQALAEADAHAIVRSWRIVPTLAGDGGLDSLPRFAVAEASDVAQLESALRVHDRVGQLRCLNDRCCRVSDCTALLSRWRT